MKHLKETIVSYFARLQGNYHTNLSKAIVNIVGLLSPTERGVEVGKMSRDKGARYEREIASQLKEYGYDCMRTAQHCGKSGDAADVVGLKGIHIECKHQEKLQIYDWMGQAIRDSKGTENKPTVFFRKNNHETLVCMRLTDWIELFREWESGNE